jgi:uncharacterized repeat protein (TIGR04076 family)
LEKNRVKITVLRCFDMKEVFETPPVKATYSGPCPVFKEGQMFYVDDSCNKPSGFDCAVAWYTVSPGVISLGWGGANYFIWYEEPGVSVTCCPDGLRPVVFKLERI